MMKPTFRTSLVSVSLLALSAGLMGCSGEANDEASLPPGFGSQQPGTNTAANPAQALPANNGTNNGAANNANQAAPVNERADVIAARGGDSNAPDNGNDGQANVRTEGLGDPNAPQDQTNNQQGQNQPPLPGTSGFGQAQTTGVGESAQQYQKADVSRDGRNYFFMANGWGPGFGSQAVSWNGTAFTVTSMTGSQGDNFEPASYPTMFCGEYSDSVSGACGLPREISSINSLRTGWSWRANGNNGQYNAAYDIWIGTGPSVNDHSGFLMVWYREPVGQQPAGQFRTGNVTVENVPGVWDIWEGQVFVDGRNYPIINWVRSEGQDTEEMEFDIMDFVRDAPNRGFNVPGSHILSVAVGFEIWNGPVDNLQSLDFYVDPQ